MILGRGISSQARAPFFTPSLVQCSMFTCRSAQPSYQKKKKRRRRSCIIQIVGLEERRRWLTDTFRLGFFFFFFLICIQFLKSKANLFPLVFFFLVLSFKLFLYYFLFVNFKNLIVKLHILIISSMLTIF